MNRLFLGLTLVLFAMVASPANAEPLSSNDAKSAAINHAASSTKRIFSIDEFGCSRTSPTTFRCKVLFKAETRWKLKDCRSRIKVTNRPALKATTVFRRCRESTMPYLTVGTARKKAMKLVDPGFRSKDFISKGGTTSWVSDTRIHFEFYWSSDREICIQEIKVALVDGSVVGNASEAACTPQVEWPRTQDTEPGSQGPIQT